MGRRHTLAERRQYAYKATYTALDVVADYAGVKTSTVEKWMSEFGVKKIADAREVMSGDFLMAPVFGATWDDLDEDSPERTTHAESKEPEFLSVWDIEEAGECVASITEMKTGGKLATDDPILIVEARSHTGVMMQDICGYQDEALKFIQEVREGRHG